MRPKSAFISYSVLDRIDTFHVKRLLEENGVKVWLDVFDIRATGKIQSDLFDIIGQKDLLCLLLSPKAVQSPWAKQEIETAVASPGVRIFPIILRPCDIPDELLDVIGFDAREGLERQSMRDLLLKAILNSDDVEVTVLFDTAERELQHDKALQDQAEIDLPKVMDAVASVSTEPTREIRLQIYPDTLPEDPDIILEVRLILNLKFSAAMSFYIARYQEGTTWPEEYSFREPDHYEFFLVVKPRLDVQLRWFDRRIRLCQVISSAATWAIGPVEYRIEFDGLTFKPKDGSLLSQTFEVPSLDTLASTRSEVKLFAHNKSTKNQ